MKKYIKVAILGCTGYAGIELVNILYNHPNVEISFLGSINNAGKKINLFDKRFKYFKTPIIKNLYNLDFLKVDVVFFALPHKVSQKIIKKNINKSNFIDLSSDFRIDDYKIYEKNYKSKHLCPNLIQEFQYGLSEIYYKKIKNSKNISVPGCYPTSILLPLIPLLKKNKIKTNNIIIDSKSGYSGAGKKFNIKNLFINDNLNFYNYNTNNHRHICEIDQELNKFSKSKVKFSFNPHILPIFRGLMSTIYCDLNHNTTKDEVLKLLKKTYSDKYFVKIINKNSKADFFSINETNKCLIKIYNHYSKNKIIIVSLIDNLLKGASGQAVQCMNLMYGFKENAGLY